MFLRRVSMLGGVQGAGDGSVPWEKKEREWELAGPQGLIHIPPVWNPLSPMAKGRSCPFALLPTLLRLFFGNFSYCTHPTFTGLHNIAHSWWRTLWIDQTKTVHKHRLHEVTKVPSRRCGSTGGTERAPRPLDSQAGALSTLYNTGAGPGFPQLLNKTPWTEGTPWTLWTVGTSWML